MSALSQVPVVVQDVYSGRKAYCKFLAANDTGITGTHQTGIYIAKTASSILFGVPGKKGVNCDRTVQIRWPDGTHTDSRFVYYGTGTRDEYRITRFGRNFSFLTPAHTGDLLVLVQMEDAYYHAHLLQSEEDIEEFLSALGMSPTDTGRLITRDRMTDESRARAIIHRFLETLTEEFPSSRQMAEMARQVYTEAAAPKASLSPDRELLGWADMEFRLLRELEYLRYGDRIARGFASVDEFIEVANMVLNRRKSRAGKSLEHHLAAMFERHGLPFQPQAKTEGNKQPDFIFPSAICYHNMGWPSDKLIFLGAKTTCKDRWRQILNEADRIPLKHLFTLQQGISSRQIDEMQAEGVVLVVPEPYIGSYPKEKRKDILTLRQFMEFVKTTLGD